MGVVLSAIAVIVIAVQLGYIVGEQIPNTTFVVAAIAGIVVMFIFFDWGPISLLFALLALVATWVISWQIIEFLYDMPFTFPNLHSPWLF